MDLTNFDLILLGLIFFLSIKGMVNGFSRELLNFIGLIGGVAVASRFNMIVGQYISDNLYLITKEPAIKLVGFIAILFAVWFLFILISSIVDKFSKEEKGFISALLGYILSIARYVALFAIVLVIAQNEYLEKRLSKHTKGSITYPHFVKIGSYVLNIDKKVADNNTTINSSKSDISLKEFDFENKIKGVE
jgi:uncharacterized membrane protein required for colicin V production